MTDTELVDMTPVNETLIGYSWQMQEWWVKDGGLMGTKLGYFKTLREALVAISLIN
tara:strand:+ start:341 stop:508 length:168 start_codon:yes stop_codon:yes gene_type:complete